MGRRRRPAASVAAAVLRGLSGGRGWGKTERRATGIPPLPWFGLGRSEGRSSAVAGSECMAAAWWRCCS